jgi:quinol monooxygenase YgiN
MKHFMIEYTLKNAAADAWHADVAAFIAALNGDPELNGRIQYRVTRKKDSTSYYHFAAAADEQAVKALQQKDFFKRYTERTREVAGGEVTVTPVEIIGETAGV